MATTGQDARKGAVRNSAPLRGALHRGARRLGFALVLAALPGPVRGDICPVHASLGTVTPGVAGAGVDENARAVRRLADAEPADAHVGEPDGQAHHGAGRVLVRDRTALGVVHVPGLVVVPGQLRVDRVLDEQRVEPGGGVLAVALRAGDEEGAELTAQAPQRVEVVAGHAGTQVLAVGDQGTQPVQVGEPVTVLAPGTGRVHEPYREFSVGVEIHSRSLAARPELRGGWWCNGLLPVSSITPTARQMPAARRRSVSHWLHGIPRLPHAR